MGCVIMKEPKIEDVYFPYPALSRTMLKRYRLSDKSLESIKHAYACSNDDNTFKKSRSLLIGHAFEAFILNMPRYKKEFYVTIFEGWRQHRRFLKALRTRGVEPLKRSEHSKFIIMRDSLLDVPLNLSSYGINTVKDLLEQDFKTQVMKVFKINGVVCKALVDIYLKLPDGKTFICDVKTSRSTFDVNSFFFDACKYGYDLQGIFYLMAFEDENVLPYFPFLVANTVAPTVVNAYNFNGQFSQKIRNEILMLVDLHKQAGNQ